MTLVRTVLGDQLRRRRQAQQRTLRDVSGRARVSLGYLSEIERGQKEPSSELLASICDALEVRVSTVLRDASERLFVAETSGADSRRERPMVMVRPVEAADLGQRAEDDSVAVQTAEPVAAEFVVEVAHLPVNVPVDRAA